MITSPSASIVSMAPSINLFQNVGQTFHTDEKLILSCVPQDKKSQSLMSVEYAHWYGAMHRAMKRIPSDMLVEVVARYLLDWLTKKAYIYAGWTEPKNHWNWSFRFNEESNLQLPTRSDRRARDIAHLALALLSQRGLTEPELVFDAEEKKISIDFELVDTTSGRTYTISNDEESYWEIVSLIEASRETGENVPVAETSLAWSKDNLTGETGNGDFIAISVYVLIN